jgi:flavin-dependent dehydrogenase
MGVVDAVLATERHLRLEIAGHRHTMPLPEAFCVVDYRHACELLRAQTDAEVRIARVVGREGDRVLLADGSTAQGRVLIDASGWRRMLDRSGPVRGDDPNLVVGSEDHAPTDPTAPTDGLAFYVERTLVASGYGWSFPAGDHVRAGVVTFARDPLNPALARLRHRDRLAPARTRHGGAIACVPRSPTEGPVLFAGDAAGHCLPLSLEGIRTAAYFGTAAGLMAGAITRGEIGTEEAHDRYRALHDAASPHFARLRWVQRMVPALHPWALRALGDLLAEPHLQRRIVQRYLRQLRPETLGDDLG